MAETGLGWEGRRLRDDRGGYLLGFFCYGLVSLFGSFADARCLFRGEREFCFARCVAVS